MSGHNQNQMWVELVGSIIIARIRGTPTESLIHECQDRIVALQADTGCTTILYDALELDRPSVDIVLRQQVLTDVLKQGSVKIAVVVPNTAIAYLSRLAFGQANHRIFYNDVASALLWLTEKAETDTGSA